MTVRFNCVSAWYACVRANCLLKYGQIVGLGVSTCVLCMLHMHVYRACRNRTYAPCMSIRKASFRPKLLNLLCIHMYVHLHRTHDVRSCEYMYDLGQPYACVSRGKNIRTKPSATVRAGRMQGTEL